MNSLLFVFTLIALNSAPKNTVPDTQSGAIFGTEFIQDAQSLQSYSEQIATLRNTNVDQVSGQYQVMINEVCSKKGCWLNVAFATGEQAFVKMEDYAFFLPMNAEGKEVIINGDLYIETVSVEELRHYAEDAGQSAEEIALITEPQEKLRITAKGILIL